MAERPTVDPSVVPFTANAESKLVINVGNPTAARIAIKLKTSDNVIYKVNPVYSFIEPGTAQPIDVYRSPVGPKDDKLVVQYMPAAKGLGSPQDAFPPGGQYPELPVTLTAS